MAANLKQSPEGLMEAFEHHVVYEVNMLRHTFSFLSVRAWSQELANAIIESFCVHARNLIDFFSEKSETPGQSNGYVGAKHFCNGYQPWTKGAPGNDLIGALNRQISHVTFDRTSKSEEKIGPEQRLELVRLIERELEMFREHLRSPYTEKWPFAKENVTATEVKVGNSPYGATNQIASVTLQLDKAGYTGPAGPTVVVKVEK
jgi:hypothetical protein